MYSMKFGADLKNSVVPEWAPGYIAYDALKAQIKAISGAEADERDALEETFFATLEEELEAVRLSMGARLRGLESAHAQAQNDLRDAASERENLQRSAREAQGELGALERPRQGRGPHGAFGVAACVARPGRRPQGVHAVRALCRPRRRWRPVTASGHVRQPPQVAGAAQLVARLPGSRAGWLALSRSSPCQMLPLRRRLCGIVKPNE